jgi:hypothetical protein
LGRGIHVHLVIAVFRVKIASSGGSALAASDEITLRALHVGAAEQLFKVEEIEFPRRNWRANYGQTYVFVISICAMKQTCKTTIHR